MTTPQPTGLHAGPTWWPLVPALRDRTPGVTGVRVAWLIVGLMAVLSAYLEARLNWSGIPVTILGVELALTVYPPLILTLLLTLWFGPAWGGTFAWLATFTSALTSGMPLALAALFALATPLELLIVWGCLTILGISPDLGSRRDTLRYLGVAVIAATASSLAALLYVDVRALDILAGQRVWQGWIVGDVLQMALAVPILRLWGSEVRGWVDRQFPEPPLHEVSYTKSVLLVTGIVLCLVALVAQGVWRTLGSLQIPAEAVTSSGEPLLPRLRELGLFLGLLSLVTFATTMVFTATLARISERVRVISRHDPLTGALNRRAFEDEYRKEADRSRRLGRGMAAVLVDLDHFKTINDRFGHEAGDDVLRQVVRRIVGVIRDHDLLFRWGGDEFLVLLPHTAPADAPGLAERVRQACTEPIVALGVPEPVVLTVSCGVAAAAEAPKEAGALVALTDAAMYRAKRGGRDRVVVG